MSSLKPLVLALFATLTISSCGGNPAPRRAAIVPGGGSPTRVASVPRTPPPVVFANSAVVMDANSGRILYEKNADTVRPVASTQKIITALCVLDAGNLEKQITITASDTRCEPTKLFMKPGEIYTRRELLRVLMVKSANDVARALARDVGGSVEGFAKIMNNKCRQLGMRNSHFVNPHGLTEPGQYSTARDMAIAARVAHRNALIRRYASTKSYTFKFSDGRLLLIETTNKLLKKIPYCDGMKTGTTNASGRCLIATGSLNGRSVICVVLKSNTANVWSDSEKLLRWSLERPVAE